MATGITYPGGTGIVGKSDTAVFIPDIWSDEIIADEDDLPPEDYEEFVWECLNPYP